MFVHISVLCTSHDVSTVGSLLGKLFLIETENESKFYSETSQVQFGLCHFKFP